MAARILFHAQGLLSYEFSENSASLIIWQVLQYNVIISLKNSAHSANMLIKHF